MRAASAGLVLTALIGGAGALAACGDGLLDPLEPCDASAPGGDIACPGACIPAGPADGCTCALPATDPRRYVVLADDQARLGTQTKVLSGHVVVRDPQGFLVVGRDAVTGSGVHAVADRAKVLPRARVGRLFANLSILGADVALVRGGPFAFSAPLAVGEGLPAFPMPAPGALSVDVPAASLLVLPPGAYDHIGVEPRGTLLLRGLTPGAGAGRYDVRSLRLGFEARLETHNPVVLNVAERAALAPRSRFGPAPHAPLAAGDVQLNVAGTAVRVGHAATLLAHVRAPAGVVRVARGTSVFGRLVAARVKTARSVLVHEGACGDGRLDLAEECDASAPFGDVACPGRCFPGDPGGESRLLLGAPGQCTCACTVDAACDDGNACNGPETCVGGVCTLGVPPACGDGNPCTRDCDPAIGCVAIPLADGRGCSDRNPCTVGDSCEAGVCVGGGPRDCDDANPCTADSCDPAEGCGHEALPDATPCTPGRACVSGVCIG